MIVSVLYREPKLLKEKCVTYFTESDNVVSVLYREPKLLKAFQQLRQMMLDGGFSALP